MEVYLPECLPKLNPEECLNCDLKTEVPKGKPAFSRITGYNEEEVISRNPSLLASGRHDRAFYEQMWTKLETDGHWQGEIWNRRRNGREYPQLLSISSIRSANDMVSHYVGVFADLSDIRHTQDQLDKLTHYDPLTHLPNRLLFHYHLDSALTRARRSANHIAVFVMDLDRLKVINEIQGIAVGDVVIQEVASRLKSILRSSDSISLTKQMDDPETSGNIPARLAGDEFVMVLEDVGQNSDVAAAAQRILDAIKTPILIQDQEITITASIGISVYPEDGEDGATLVQHADAASRVAKESGRDTFQFYSSEVATSVAKKFALESRLRNALERHEFVVYYQPQYSIRENRIVGVEALLRWHNPDKGVISPADFIPLAEETGLIVPIGEWVIHTSCAQAVAWVADGLPPLRMAVNLSPRQLSHSDLPQVVAKAL